MNIICLARNATRTHYIPLYTNGPFGTAAEIIQIIDYTVMMTEELNSTMPVVIEYTWKNINSKKDEMSEKKTWNTNIPKY